ncbi:hypothetical protein K493DRAFT_392128 [Basidiobolus meristosporus CBS 931.73]|uniref:Uncharacterized protein n=1 Tax=Basidiobolus meristosporus CBS 931.73 TaxID=1314790 RepID=A0A1Y1WWB2_9FUNG|nr:hypothetical protein K493DRAFT_392128 [Basidiobolus meristosporus CBS 931.73]|eukprot:ORX77752.1 hypothetical protein K493DRAFT_392128 [Basidiobolus meristosporus CBS 931.73]
MYDYRGNQISAEDHKLKTIGQGAATHVVTAFDSSIKSRSGSYLQDCWIDNDAATRMPRAMKMPRDREKLSEKLVGATFDVISEMGQWPLKICQENALDKSDAEAFSLLLDIFISGLYLLVYFRTSFVVVAVSMAFSSSGIIG